MLLDNPQSTAATTATHGKRLNPLCKIILKTRPRILWAMARRANAPPLWVRRRSEMTILILTSVRPFENEFSPTQINRRKNQ